MSSSGLQEFLQSRKQVPAGVGIDLEVVMGNQACDLDSVVSAITLAYLHHLQQQKQIGGTGTAIFGERWWLPIIPVPFKEVALRTEPIDLDGSMKLMNDNPKSLRFTLVDHNSLSNAFSSFAEAVVEIVDHHEDLNASFPNLQRKQIEVVGSTSTLVAELFLQDEEGREEIKADNALRRLLLGTILLDTVGLDMNFGKTFPKDQEIARALHEMDPEIDIVKFFQSIQAAKFDNSSMCAAEHLIKDYKEWKADSGAIYGVSTVLLSIEKWLSVGEDLHQHFAKFAADNNLSVLFCMLAFHSDESFHRELVIFKPSSAPKPIDFTRLLRELVSGVGKERLQLSAVNSALVSELVADSEGSVWVFSQNNIKASRKALQPLLHDILAKL